MQTKRKLNVTLDEWIIQKVDAEKGFASRSIILNEILKDGLRYREQIGKQMTDPEQIRI